MKRKQPIRGPLAGLLASPCGVWVRIETDDRGAGWRRLLLAMTRRGVLGREAFNSVANRHKI